VLGDHVTLNEPFRGGYITRHHASEMPWLQLELSRAPFATNAEKRGAVLEALGRWVRETGRSSSGSR
jgi:N-formylglutamate amidohydrolase